MSQRRSSRLLSKPKLQFANSSEDQGAPAESQPPPKRRKIASKAQAVALPKKTVKRKGKLRDLPEMPLDILFDIFSHLNPLDILRLARTTKALRSILMHRSSMSIWKIACTNLEGFPECPQDLTFPQYVNLAFSSHCHKCLSRNASHIVWISRVRLCKSCFEASVLDVFDLPKQYSWLPPGYSGMLFRFSRRNKWYSSLDSCLEESVQELCQAYSACEPTEKEKFSEDRRQLVDDRTTHAKLCIKWEQQSRGNRAGELSDLRNRRKKAIIAKLTELGFGEDMKSLDRIDQLTFNNHPLVKQPKELTDRIWANISSTILALMPGFRSKRLAREKAEEIKRRRKLFNDIVKEFATSRPLEEFTPSAADFYFMEEAKNFRQLIEDTPPGQSLSAGHLDELKALLPELSTQWKVAKTKILFDALQSRDGNKTNESADENADLDLAIFNLATSLFNCSRCNEFITYPRVLEHSCMRYRSFNFGGSDITACYDDLEGKPWDAGRQCLTCTKEDLESLKKVIKAYGKDPKVATIEDLDAEDGVFTCKRCSNSWSYLALGWRQAPRHVNHEPGFDRLEDNDAVKAKNIAQQDQLRARTSGARSWKCLICKMPSQSLQRLKTHLHKDHDIQTATEGTHYVFGTDNPSVHNFKVTVSRGDTMSTGGYLGFDYGDDDDDDDMNIGFGWGFFGPGYDSGSDDYGFDYY